MTDLSRFVEMHPSLFILTGAGISTGSGIPDYRDGQGRWKRRQPVTMQDFLRSASVRRRYWARSIVGWPVLANARPNAAHLALARLETAGRVQHLVTQNVDGLHQRAGSTRVVELHGTVAWVVCLNCGAEVSRFAIQEMLEAANPECARLVAATAPDGDADLDAHDLDGFEIPACFSCGGILKPDVVFFGDGVPRERVEIAMDALQHADAMLVVGSSLMTYSGFRFCEQAHRAGKPIAAVNLGRTRADGLLSLKVERPCAEPLVELIQELGLTERQAEAV